MKATFAAALLSLLSLSLLSGNTVAASIFAADRGIISNNSDWWRPAFGDANPDHNTHVAVWDLNGLLGAGEVFTSITLRMNAQPRSGYPADATIPLNTSVWDVDQQWEDWVINDLASNTWLRPAAGVVTNWAGFVTDASSGDLLGTGLTHKDQNILITLSASFLAEANAAALGANSGLIGLGVSWDDGNTLNSTWAQHEFIRFSSTALDYEVGAATVSEPSVLALMGLTLAGLLGFGRRRQA